MLFINEIHVSVTFSVDAVTRDATFSKLVADAKHDSRIPVGVLEKRAFDLVEVRQFSAVDIITEHFCHSELKTEIDTRLHLIFDTESHRKAHRHITVT